MSVNHVSLVVLLIISLLGCGTWVRAGETATAEAAAPGIGDQPAPLPEAAAAFPEYPVSEVTERELALTPAEIAAVILDYTEQCKTCRYRVGSVVSQEVFERAQHPHRFLVWQDVNKEINVLVGKIPFRSSSWTEVSVFASADQRTIIIDSRALDAQRAEAVSASYDRPSKPAFELLHSRWTITALPAQGDGAPRSLVAGIVGGKGAGISTLVPDSVMRKELKGVMEETLDFVVVEDPERR